MATTREGGKARGERRAGSQETCLPGPWPPFGVAFGKDAWTSVEMQVRLRREGGRMWPVVIWRPPVASRMVASAPHGGGIGPRRWIMNAQVPASYGRRDPDHHLGRLAVSLGLAGRGVGLLTAADVRSFQASVDGGVGVWATLGVERPTWAAAPPDDGPVSLVGTINVVVVLPERMSDAALVNLVGTATEAKAQALWEGGLAATGTATDAVCIACPAEGPAHAFGGPRSIWGSRVARAVHQATTAGLRA